MTEEDLRGELIQLKRRYGLLSKEHAVLKTHLQVASNDLKKRENEIENLLQDPVTPTKYQEQLELNSLKRRVIQYERAMREKSEEISKLLSDKDLFNATQNRQKLEKLEKDYEKLKYRLGKSVPHAELEAEKTRLSELIESLHRENNELYQILSTFFQDAENGVFLDGTGMRDTKLLAKMKEEAAARKSEVEYYQKALATLIRDRSHHGPGLLGSSDKNRKSQNSINNKRPKSGKTVLNGHQPNAFPLSTKISLPNIPREKDKSRKTKSTEKQLVLKPINKSTPYQSSSRKVELKTPGPKYAESESSMKSGNESGSEYGNRQKPRIKKRIGSEESSLGSYVTNEEYDDDSNIGKITSEYLEKVEIEEKTEILITALRCQLLREEMLQTRVLSF
ncbi:hypothetical protein FO519_003072 [Halicephalobus sp. NKZ332]|nr:hypothetical protein FO519_003072 [Halicephalobus sp. NKZ332]